MNEDLLKVQLSPVDGQMYGTFSEGFPIAQATGFMFAIQVDDKRGGRIRRFGKVTGVADWLKNIDNEDPSSEQVVRTVIYFDYGIPLEIKWADTAVAVAEIALMEGDMDA